MINIILRGCNGRMGQVISDIVKNDTQSQIVAGVDLTKRKRGKFISGL